METRGDLRSKVNSFTVKRLALLSILTALCYIGRIVFQFLPNVQPMTAILLLITLNLGLVDGLIVATTSLVLSNMVLGMGPWFFAQVVTYFIIIAFTGYFLRPIYLKKRAKIFFSIYAFLVGMIFGFIISIFSSKMFGMTNFWVYYMMGLPFDLAHAFGNAGFFFILEPILTPIIKAKIKY